MTTIDWIKWVLMLIAGAGIVSLRVMAQRDERRRRKQEEGDK